MSFLASIFGGGTVTTLADTIAKGADALFTSDEERLDKQALLARIQQQPLLAQTKINLQEASHRSIFVAGWRPFIGWVGGSALAYHFIFQPLIAWGMAAWGPAGMVPPPMIETGPLFTLLLAMLGIGGLRTIEKAKGLAK